MNTDALQLWIDWFESDGNPWYVDDYGRDWCFFCGEEQPNHEENCVFLKAKILIEEKINEHSQSQTNQDNS